MLPYALELVVGEHGIADQVADEIEDARQVFAEGVKVNADAAPSGTGADHRAEAVDGLVVLLKRAVGAAAVEVVRQQRGDAGTVVHRRALAGVDAEAAVNCRVARTGLSENNDAVGQRGAEETVRPARLDAIADVARTFQIERRDRLDLIGDRIGNVDTRARHAIVIRQLPTNGATGRRQPGL